MQCRYIARPAVSEKRLSLLSNGNVRYDLKTPYRDGATHLIFEPMDFIAQQRASCTGDAGQAGNGKRASMSDRFGA